MYLANNKYYYIKTNPEDSAQYILGLQNVQLRGYY